MIEVSDLVKRYPGAPAPAVDGISFNVEEGEVFASSGRTAPARRPRCRSSLPLA
jgi:ABC-type Na+ transport system ATPase subunit NatA